MIFSENRNPLFGIMLYAVPHEIPRDSRPARLYTSFVLTGIVDGNFMTARVRDGSTDRVRTRSLLRRAIRRRE